MSNSPSYNRRVRSSRGSFLQNNLGIILIFVVIIGLFFTWFLFPKEKQPVETSSVSMQITPKDAQSEVYISPTEGSKQQITQSGALYTSDFSAIVKKGSATGKINNTFIDIDDSVEAEFSFEGSYSTGEVLRLRSGRAWITGGDNGTIIHLDNLSANIPPNGIIIAEQTNNIFSTIYAIKDEVNIVTSIGQYSLPHGKKIAISSGQIESGTKLQDIPEEIDASITQIPVFTRNQGSNYLVKDGSPENSENPDALEALSGSISTASNQTIQITQPAANTVIKNTKTTIMGALLNKNVKRITFNNIDASVSPVNETFTVPDFPITQEVNDIVFKSYDQQGVLLEIGVFVLFGPKGSTSNNTPTLIPQNYPVSIKDFPIISPDKNPFRTTNTHVRVKGTVPKNTVKYITVNNYRLQKFIPNSTTWYYHANTELGTMKEGQNLYVIKFFDANDRPILKDPLLFTIIKHEKESPTNI